MLPVTPPTLPPNLPPMRVLPVAPMYAMPVETERPGVITVVGVMSIIVAVATMMLSCGTAIFSGITFIEAQQQTLAINLSKMPLVPLVAPPDSVPPDGVAEAAAKNIVDGLRLARPLTTNQAAAMQQLARKHGKKLFPFATEGTATTLVRNNVSESGEVLLSPGKTATYYVVGLGRIEVTPQQAIFRGEEGSVLRSTDFAADRSLDENAISQQLNSVNLQLDSPLNAAQEAALKQLMRDPEQITFSSDQTANYLPAGNFQNGGIWIHTAQAQIRVASDGTPTLLSPTTPMPGNNPVTGKPITTGWASALLGESAVNALCGVLLLIAAIFLLRGWPVGRKLHLVYAIAGIPLAIAGAWIFGNAFDEWINAGGNNSPALTGTGAAAVVGILSLIWPIVVLIVMSRASVRNYFKSVI